MFFSSWIFARLFQKKGRGQVKEEEKKMTKSLNISPISLYDYSAACLKYNESEVEESRNLRDGTKIDVIRDKESQKFLILHLCTGVILWAKILD